MITTNNITKKYGDFTAINDLSFNVNEGEILCLLGANGAGKSTIINILLNFTLPSLGTAEINNLDVIKNPIKTKEFITYIPENLMLYPTLSAVENLDYFTKLSNKTFDQQQLQNFLSEAGLEKAAHNNRVNTFSKGMRQKVGIALAIATPSFFIFLSNEINSLLDFGSKPDVGSSSNKTFDSFAIANAIPTF